MAFGAAGLSKSLFGIGLLALCAACSSSQSSDGGDTGTPASILNDPQVPTCNESKNYQLQGMLAGQAIVVSEFQLNDLEANALQIVEVVNETVRTDLSLSWSAPLAADKVIALTGTSVRVSDDQPLAGQSFCISGGDLGAPTPSDPSQGRTVRFRLTGMRQGDCSGMPVAGELKGCVWRSATASFPGSG